MSATPPEHAIANRLFIRFPPVIFSRARSVRTRARATRVRPQPYAMEPWESGEVRRGARWRARVERGRKRRLGEEFLGLPAVGHRAEEGGRNARDRGAALGTEGAQGAMRRPGAFAEGGFARVLLAGRAANLGRQRRGVRPRVREQRPGCVERDAREREPGGDAVAEAIRDHGRFFSTDARALPAVNPGGSGILRSDMKGRLEDRRLLTGQGRFISDWNFPNQAYAAFLRSDRAHAEIVSIDAAAALAAPGVLLVLTGKDVAEAGYKSIPANLGVKDRFGEPLKKPPRPVLAQGKVRHVGECVACVVAESAQLAQDAAELIAVEYRDLPAVTVADKALAPGAAQLHAELPGNLSFDWVAGDEAATEAAFRAADRVVKLALENPRMVGNPMEPRACAGRYDAATQKYALYACTQGTAGMRGQLVYTMGVPDDKIDVIAEDVGGGFGVRFNMYPEYSAVLLAAKKTGRPVKWTGSRSEVFLSDEQGRDVASTSELALDSSGKFLALRFSYIADLGAYLAPTGPFINTQGVVACLTGIYAVPAACARVKLAVTNKAPGAAYRGAGRPVMSYMLERLVDEAAVELGIDPAELRRKNLVTQDKFPYKAANGIIYA